jgi:kinesin family protein 2/24
VCLDHENLIKVILEEEEVLISTHRSHIDSVVEIVKQDMNLLQQVDMPNSDIEDYVLKLDELLLAKMEMLNQVRGKLVGFYQNLKKEEMLQKFY